MSSGTEKWLADGRAGRIRQSLSLAALVGKSRWDEEQVCAEVRDYVVEHLDDGQGILAVDETSFLKRGEESVGVGDNTAV
jgi:SRSO17 transposase